MAGGIGQEDCGQDSPEYPREVFGGCTPEEVLPEYDQPLFSPFQRSGSARAI